jgi:hypothetical protein
MRPHRTSSKLPASLLLTPPVCRFLRARKWDLAATMAMFEESEKWRKEFKVDELYHNFEYPEKEQVNEVYPQYYHKQDKVRIGETAQKVDGRIRCSNMPSPSSLASFRMVAPSTLSS